MKNYRSRKQWVNLLKELKIYDLDGILFHLVGSFRRQKEILGDLDFIVTNETYLSLLRIFEEAGEVTFLADGEVFKSFDFKYDNETYQFDFKIVEDLTKCTLMYLHFTGSTFMNIALRSEAKRKNRKLNEYEFVFSDGTSYYPKDEEEMFDILGFHFIPPKERTADFLADAYKTLKKYRKETYV